MRDLYISRIELPFLLQGNIWTNTGEYINHSQTHECGNWDWGHAIPRKEIHKWNFSCSAPFLRKTGDGDELDHMIARKPGPLYSLDTLWPQLTPFPAIIGRNKLYMSRSPPFLAPFLYCAEISEQSMGSRNRVGRWLFYWPPGYIGWWQWFLGINSWAP